MAYALPVAAQADPWIDYLIEGQTAWLIDNHDPDQWVSLILGMIQDPARRRELGIRAREWVKQNRPFSDHLDQLIGIYRRVTGKSIKFPRS
jgi:glycosyltransferase involved in cell wall biosynthesis